MGSKNEKFDSKGREKIQCKVCDCWYHRLEIHLKSHSINVEEYLARHPGAPTISLAARRMASKAATKSKAKAKSKSVPTTDTSAPDDGLLKLGVARLKLVDDSELTSSQKAEVPIHDDDWLPGKREMDHMESIAVGIEDNDNVFIYGPTGGGKTTIVKQMAAILNVPCIRFQFSNKISIEDFVGQMEVTTDENGNQITAWKDGAFTRAWREGYYIILDEYTLAPSGISMRLQAPLEGDDLVLIENGGEVIPKHPRTRIFATDNTNGRGDDTGLYVGTNVINEAALDRFGTVIKFDYPDSQTEQQILVQKSGIDVSLALKMVRVAAKIRDAFNREECYCTFSTRRLIFWAKKSVRYGDPRKAATVAVLNKLSVDDSTFVDQIIQRHFGGTV